MPKRRTNEQITAKHFTWKLRIRSGVYYADGRANAVDAGRHSLGTRDREEALRRLHDLDTTVAINNGIAEPPPPKTDNKSIGLTEGRQLYEEHLKRPRALGGVRASTFKRYRPVFDKFIPFARSKEVGEWNAVTNRVLTSYASHLQSQEYLSKTIRNEMTTLVQAFKWLVQEGHISGVEPLRITLKKVQSRKAYCYRPCEVEAMVKLCKDTASLSWLADVIIALACTGLRIAELAGMRWSDVDLAAGLLTLTDETGYAPRENEKRRELKPGVGRSIPLHPDLAAALTRIARKDKFVFHGPRGGRLKPDTVRNILIREVIKPLIPKFMREDGEEGFERGRLHSFRHYFASMCANRGIPERVVMVWLGHHDSEMVRHYYHLHDEESKRQMGRLSLLGNSTAPNESNGEQASSKDAEEPRNGASGGADQT